MRGGACPDSTPRCALLSAAMPQLPSRAASSTARVAGGWMLGAALAACGGGGSDAPMPPGPPATIDYPHSVALGLAAPADLVYAAAVGTAAATVTGPNAATLLPAGTTALLAEHSDPRLPGLRVACVSGNGDSTNVVAGINLGVIAESAAVLLDARWSAVDPAQAWSAAVASGAAWSGWENCGVKPEGAPSPSSRLVPEADGGYSEDVYDGNPSTTFNVVRRQVAPAEVDAMLSPAGGMNAEDSQRPLQLTLRAYGDAGGHTVFIEIGVPAAGAPAAARGFIALYAPA